MSAVDLHTIVASAGGSAVSIEITVVLLLLIAAAVSVVTRLVRLPYTVTLVLAGLVVAVSGLPSSLDLSADLIFYVFLPVILFEAALNTPGAYLLASWKPIAILAVPGVLLAFGLTAGGLRLLTGESWSTVLLFGALIVATDPVSVVALFRRLKIDRHLSTIIDGESLFNDGTAAVVFAIVLSGVTAHAAPSPGGAVLRFMWMAGGGLALGWAVGTLASRAHHLLDERLLELMLTMITAYGSFLAAQRLGMSGPVACVVAGLVVGNVGRRIGMSDGVASAVNLFWEFAAFLVNSLVFLLIGLRTNLGAIADHLGLVVIAFVVVLASRAVTVYAAGATSRLIEPRLPFRWQHVLVWGGLRGSVALALALSIPASVEDRGLIVTTAFGVVLISLVLQGLTMRPLVRGLGLSPRRRRPTNVPPSDTSGDTPPTP